MIRRKTILAAVASGALLLPLALAVPASAQPGPGPRCENPVNCEQHNPDGSVVRINIGIGNGGNCDNDKLLLVRVRIDAGRAGSETRRDRDAYNTAIGEYNAAKRAYDKGYDAWTPATGIARNPANYQATPEGSALHQTLVNATTKRDNAKNKFSEAQESGRLLDAKIALLTGRINGAECNTPPPTTVPPAPTTDVPPPTVIDQPPATIVQQPPVIINNPQVGTVPSGPAPTGGGALRDQVS